MLKLDFNSTAGTNTVSVIENPSILQKILPAAFTLLFFSSFIGMCYGIEYLKHLGSLINTTFGNILAIIGSLVLFFINFIILRYVLFLFKSLITTYGSLYYDSTKSHELICHINNENERNSSSSAIELKRLLKNQPSSIPKELAEKINNLAPENSHETGLKFTLNETSCVKSVSSPNGLHITLQIDGHSISLAERFAKKIDKFLPYTKDLNPAKPFTKHPTDEVLAYWLKIDLFRNEEKITIQPEKYNFINVSYNTSRKD